jgi:hypothetical protein
VRRRGRAVEGPALGVALTCALVLGQHLRASHPQAPPADPPPAEWFIDAVSADEAVATSALTRLGGRWHDGYAPILIDLLRFTRPDEPARTVDVSGVQPRSDPQSLTYAPGRTGAEFRSVGGQRSPTAHIRTRLVRFLEQQTGERFGDDLDRWRRWSWQLPYTPHPDYLAMKAELSRGVDPRMSAFFSPLAVEAVRLDELEWSGVGVDDVPPLVHPKQVPAGDARHMRDRQLVAGLLVNGEARAYPLRILAWHHVAHDRAGGRDVLIVHCPMSGVTAAYDLSAPGAPDRFGTSGFVYRSGSLLYDTETDSLWSMLTGSPVLGRLAGADLSLQPLPLLVTTWRDWRAVHPRTTVLSQDTGHPFTYAEGALTRRRLASAGLVFPPPEVDLTLRSEDEVEGVRPRGDGRAVAIATRSLRTGHARDVDVEGRRYVVTASRDGGVRVYEAPEARIVRQRGGCLEDTDGRCWRATDDALILDGGNVPHAPRVPSVRAWWIAWAAMYPDTLVIR